ncbi:unnamed protein product [Urochloa humidicola]
MTMSATPSDEEASASLPTSPSSGATAEEAAYQERGITPEEFCLVKIQKSFAETKDDQGCWVVQIERQIVQGFR